MTQLLPHFKQDLDSVVLVPSSGGRFEVELDGDPVYSKLSTQEFPDTDELLRDLDSKING